MPASVTQPIYLPQGIQGDVLQQQKLIGSLIFCLINQEWGFVVRDKNIPDNSEPADRLIILSFGKSIEGRPLPKLIPNEGYLLCYGQDYKFSVYGGYPIGQNPNKQVVSVLPNGPRILCEEYSPFPDRPPVSRLVNLQNFTLEPEPQYDIESIAVHGWKIQLLDDSFPLVEWKDI